MQPERLAKRRARRVLEKSLTRERVRILERQGFYDLIPPKEFPHAFPFEYLCSCGRRAIGKDKYGSYVCDFHNRFPTSVVARIDYLIDKP